MQNTSKQQTDLSLSNAEAFSIFILSITFLSCLILSIVLYFTTGVAA